MSVVGGLIVLIVALAAASLVGAWLRRRQGQLRDRRPRSSTVQTDPADSLSQSPAAPALTAEDLGAPLGERATLVQFSTEFCSYCGPTRDLLAEVAREQSGVAFVEVDAAARMDLTRRLRILSTPTVLLLRPDGVIERRASGKPRKSELLAAVGAVLGEGGDS